MCPLHQTDCPKKEMEQLKKMFSKFIQTDDNKKSLLDSHEVRWLLAQRKSVTMLLLCFQSF